ncbi:MAG: response regulator transcription factor [Gemmatimonadaceae bacterium]|nr:response regulator transcription factor [Chitinophagaceae bacterium]
MTKLNCIIIDDEPLARKGLKEYIAEMDFLSLRGEYENPLKATAALTSGDVHLLLLDIQMPKITGLDFLRSLAQPPLAIITTAYPEYALQGFELNVIDYLLKPFSFDRFLKAVLKAKTHYEGAHRIPTPEVATDAGYFFVKTDNKLVKVAHDEVLFIEALQNYVAVYTTAKKYVSYLTIKSVEEQLPGSRFIKVHKSFIVAADKVETIEGNELRIGPHRIPVSRSIKEEVLHKILQNRLLKR